MPLLVAILALALGGTSGGNAAPFTVAIDPGHGGTNLGAQVEAGPGRVRYEKRIILDLARRLRRHLDAEPGIRVVLCRNSDVLVSIRARVRCANESGARVFLSLHTNASPEGIARGSQQGFELYVPTPEDVDEGAALVGIVEKNDADAAWASHLLRAAAEDSAMFARRLQLRLSEALGARADRGIKQSGASLDVLRGLRIPGVLVEVGFLDHPEEGARLQSAEGLETIATALAQAVGDFRTYEARSAAAMAAPTGKPVRPAGR